MKQETPRLVIKMLRPNVAYILVVFASVGIAQSGYSAQLAWQYLALTIVLAAWYINGTSINDLADYEIDKINLKGSRERPLANKKTTRTQIKRLAVASAATALIAGLALDYRIGLAAAVGLILNYIYSMPPLRISYRGLWAPLLLPLGYVVLPFLVGVWSVDGKLTHDGRLYLLALYISFIGRIILKDFRDVTGDAAFGKRTFLLRYGRRVTVYTSALCLIAGTGIIVAALPQRFEIAATFFVLLGCALYGLRQLLLSEHPLQEQIAIRAVVKVAGGAVIVLLSILYAGNLGKSVADQTLLTAGLGLLFAALFYENIKPVTSRSAAA